MSDVELIEIRPGTWAVKRLHKPPARSSLPMPMVISDIMPETEQVDGKFYTSKSEFRRVGKALGLIEVGNEKPKPRPRAVSGSHEKEKRRASIKKAVQRFRAGERTRSP